MRLSIHHTLTFSLGTPARAVQHVLMTPAPTPQQKIERWSIEMPGFATASTFRDGFSNRAHLVSQVKPDAEMVVTVSGVVETTDRAGVLGRLDYEPVPAVFRRPTATTKPDSALSEDLPAEDGRIAMLHELMTRVHKKLGAPTQIQAAGTQSQSQATSDPVPFAHAFIGVARSLDIPARHVTGYLLDDGHASFHAWAEAWDERLGWIGFDPKFDVCPAETYVRLAIGLDAMSSRPLRPYPMWVAMPVEVVEITAE